MSQYRVTVNVKAEFQYTVDVEAEREIEAEDEARNRWKEMMPSDFQVNKGYLTDLEVDDYRHLTQTCERCGTEYALDMDAKEIAERFGSDPVKPWSEDQAFCAACGELILAEEKEAQANG